MDGSIINGGKGSRRLLSRERVKCLYNVGEVLENSELSRTVKMKVFMAVALLLPAFAIAAEVNLLGLFSFHRT